MNGWFSDVEMEEIKRSIVAEERGEGLLNDTASQERVDHWRELGDIENVDCRSYSKASTKETLVEEKEEYQATVTGYF